MTDIKSFKQLLLDGKIKPSSKTKNRNQNPYDFLSPYNFFNTIPKTQLKSFTKVHGVGIVYNQNILLGRVFYTNKNHSAGNTKSSKKYKISDKKELRKVLYSLYTYSFRTVRKIKMETWILSTFQEVFTRLEPTLNEAIYVILNPAELKTIKKIKTMYPNIQIITSKTSGLGL